MSMLLKLLLRPFLRQLNVDACGVEMRMSRVSWAFPKLVPLMNGKA
jgi:hypothetical protein